MPRKIVLGLVFLVMLVVLGGIAVFQYESSKSHIETKVGTKGEVLTLETAKIDTLYPHGHVVGVDALGDEGHHIFAQSDLVVLEKDVWITGIEYDIKGAPAVTLHHGVVLDLSRPDLECPKEKMGLAIVTVAQDQKHTPNAYFADGYGIFLPKGTPLQMDAMFHNPNHPVGPGEVYTDVSLEVNFLLAEEGRTDLKPLQSHLLQLSESPCTPFLGDTFSVPALSGEYVFSGTKLAVDPARLVITKPSRIIYWGAHLHGWEGARSLTVKRNGEVLEIFNTVKNEADGYVYDTPHGNRDILLEPGDVISIEALYVNNSTSSVRQAMGQLGIYIAEE